MALVALPAYQQKVRKAEFAEYILAVDSVRKVVDACIALTPDPLDNCGMFHSKMVRDAARAVQTPNFYVTVRKAAAPTSGMLVAGHYEEKPGSFDYTTYYLLGDYVDRRLIWRFYDATSNCLRKGYC